MRIRTIFKLHGMHRVSAVILCAASASWAAETPIAVLELPQVDGARFVRLQSFPNQVMVLNFWSSDCPPCVTELPLLSAQAQSIPSVQFLGIAVDPQAQAQHFLTLHPVTYPQLLAPRAGDGLMRRFGNPHGTLPYTVVLDPGHRACKRFTGAVDAAWLQAALSACGKLAEPASNK